MLSLDLDHCSVSLKSSSFWLRGTLSIDSLSPYLKIDMCSEGSSVVCLVADNFDR